MKDYVDYVLKPDTELRFEVEDKDVKVYVLLITGMAEMFGTELVKGRSYEFGMGAKVAIFTYHGCLLQLRGKTEVSYISKETPMIQYLNCHAALENFRLMSENRNTRGPVAMVVGPKDVGKSTLCRILLNYAARCGRRPLYVDTDIDQGYLSMPSTIAAIRIERPAIVEGDFSNIAPLVYHIGHRSPSTNSTLYKSVVSKIAENILDSINTNKRTKYSGIIINTCGWVRGDGYFHLVHTAQAFEVNVIFVLDQERLYNELLRDMPSFVRVIMLPKSGGVVVQSKELRSEAAERRIKEYFYGVEKKPLFPFSFEVAFNELKLYKIGAPSLPDSCMPIGMNSDYHKTKLMAVTPSNSLLHHILSVSFAESIEDDVLGTNIAGFVCVTGINVTKQVITILSPQPRPLPNSILLLSDVQFMDGYD